MNRVLGKISALIFKRDRIKFFSMIMVLMLSIIMFNVPNIIDGNLLKERVTSNQDFYGNYETEITSNNDNLKNLKKWNEVKKAYQIAILGNVSFDSRYKSELYTFDKDYLKENNYILVDGKLPEKDNEIVLNEKFMNRYKNKKIIGKEISLTNTYSYLNNGIITNKSFPKNFKVVGIVKKDFKISTNKTFDFPSRSFVYLSESIVKKTYPNTRLITQIFYKNGYNSIDSKNEYLRSLYGEETEIENNKLMDINEDYNDYKAFKTDIDKNLIVLLISVIFIWTMYSLVEKKIIRDLGVYRLVGLSKKETGKILNGIYMKIILISNTVGVLSSYVFSYIILNDYKRSGYISEAYLDINFKFLIITLISVDIITYLTYIYLARKINTLTIQEQLNYGYKPKIIKNNSKASIKNKLIASSLLNSFMIIFSIIAISMSGILYIKYNSSNFDLMDENYNSKGNMFNNNKYALLKYIDANDYTFDESEISDIKAIEGLENIYLKGEVGANINLNKKDISQIYYSMIQNSDSNSYNAKITIETIDIGKSKSSLEPFVNKGKVSDIGKITKDGYYNIAMMNSVYKQGIMPVIKELELGNKYNLKLENGKTIKVKICCIINPGWRFAGLSTGTKDIEVIADLKTFKDMFDRNTVNSLSFDITGDEGVVESKINKYLLENNIPYYLVNKEKYIPDFEKFIFDQKILIISTLLFVFSIASFTISLYVIFDNRTKEFNVLRSIGICKKGISELIAKESIVYISIITIITSVVTISSDYSFYLHTKKVFVEELGIKNILPNIYLPPIQLIIFLISIIFIAYFTVKIYIIKNMKNEKINI